MNPKAVYKYCKNLGCCEACCLRYMGIKNPNAYENVANFVLKYQDEIDKPLSIIEQSQNIASKSTDTKQNLLDVSIREDLKNSNGNSLDINGANRKISNGDSDTNPPPSKRRRLDICVSCLGVLQEDNWMESYVLVKDVLFKKRYECVSFACALSAPITTLLRERAVTLRLADEFPGYDDKILTPLKEAWKWSFGVKLATEIHKNLDSGAISPLLISLNYDYADDLQELEILKQVSPQLFEERSKQKRRFVTEFTRRSVEQALQNASLQSLRAAGGGLPAAGVRAMCIGAVCTHAPAYLAGRYIKLSRHLPQSPWILEGKRVLPSSVQEIIYKPLADLYNLDAEQAEGRLKLIAAGREDVDVRCLGEGRPFAIEITDPTRQLTPEELASACELISNSGEVIVKQIVPITREDLIQLKKGEETKSKTYEAICIKLSHSKYDDVSPDSPIKVTPEDITRINSFRNTPRNPKDTENTQISLNHTHKSTTNNLESSKSVCNISGDIKDTTDILDSCEDKDQDDKDKRGGHLGSPDNSRTVKEPNSQDVKDALDITRYNSTPMKVQITDNPDNPNDDKNNEIDSFVNVREIENRERTDAEDDIVDTLTSVQNVLDSPDSSKDFLDTSVEAQESENRNNCEDVRIIIQQKTPIRVLHRRPLLTRTRHILELKAIEVPDHPQLFRMFVRTSAGTYVKEWAHGELGRSRPSLGDVLGSRVDMLALDVTAVHLKWPPQ